MDRHCPPPVLFSELKETTLPDSLRPVVEYLLDLKINSPEKMTIPHLRELDEFLSDSAENISRYMQELPEDGGNHWETLNRFFLEETGR